MQVGEDDVSPRACIGRVEEEQEDYKCTLVELLAVVMHPPDFTERTGRYAWCINVNKLLCKLNSVKSKLPTPADVPTSFVDVDEFISDAWRLAFAEEVLDFYEKWPPDLDRLVEESFRSGIPLGRMMLTESGAAAGAIVREEHQQQHSRRGSAAISAATARDNSAMAGASPTSTAAVTPCTPHSSPFGRVNRTQSLSSTTLYSPSLSPLRKFCTADFEQFLRQGDYMDTSSGSALRHSTRTVSASTIPTVRFTPSSPLPETHTESAPPPSESPTLTPAPERSHGGNREKQLERAQTSSIRESEGERERSTPSSQRRSASERPWIPQSYRDGSMPAENAELFYALDEVCQEADALIVEAEDIDATDKNENAQRLTNWTVRARKCELNGRAALTRISSTDLSGTDEVRYVASTLRLLKSAHRELHDYASMARAKRGSPSNDTLRQEDDNGGAEVDSGSQHREYIEPVLRGMVVQAADTSAVEERREAGRASPGPSRQPFRRRLTPYILLPSVPWKWRPSTPPHSGSDASESDDGLESESEVESEPKPKSITIRVRRGGPDGDPSSSNQGGTHHVIRLQRMTDQEPGDKEHVPPCQLCALRGFSCFGKAGKGCRRCRRIRKGCTYARSKGGLATVPATTTAPASAAASTSQLSVLAKTKGKGKGKQKEKHVEFTAKTMQKRRIGDNSRGTRGRLDKGKKRPRSRRSSVALRKLRDARARLSKEMTQRRLSATRPDPAEEVRNNNNDDADGEFIDDEDDECDRPRKRRRHASSRPLHEFELELDANVGSTSLSEPALPRRATSETPDRARSSSKRPTPTFASLARSSTNTNTNTNADSNGSGGPSLPPSLRDRYTSEGWDVRRQLQSLRLSVERPQRCSSADARDDASMEVQVDLDVQEAVQENSLDLVETRMQEDDIGLESVQQQQQQQRRQQQHEMRAFRNDVRSDMGVSPDVIPNARAGIPPSVNSNSLLSAIASPLNAQTLEQPSTTAFTVSGSTAIAPGTATIPTPTSLVSSGPHDLAAPLPLPSLLPSTITPHNPSASQAQDQNSLANKLDVLIASLTNVVKEFEEAQKKLVLQAGVIEEMREALRVLGAPVEASKASTATTTATAPGATTSDMDADLDVDMDSEGVQNLDSERMLEN